MHFKTKYIGQFRVSCELFFGAKCRIKETPFYTFLPQPFPRLSVLSNITDSKALFHFSFHSLYSSSGNLYYLSSFLFLFQGQQTKSSTALVKKRVNAF